MKLKNNFFFKALRVLNIPWDAGFFLMSGHFSMTDILNLIMANPFDHKHERYIPAICSVLYSTSGEWGWIEDKQYHQNSNLDNKFHEQWVKGFDSFVEMLDNKVSNILDLHQWIQSGFGKEKEDTFIPPNEGVISLVEREGKGKSLSYMILQLNLKHNRQIYLSVSPLYKILASVKKREMIIQTMIENGEVFPFGVGEIDFFIMIKPDTYLDRLSKITSEGNELGSLLKIGNAHLFDSPSRNEHLLSIPTHQEGEAQSPR